MFHRDLKSIFYILLFITYIYLLFFIVNNQPDLSNEEKVQIFQTTVKYNNSTKTVINTVINIKQIIDRILNETRNKNKWHLRNYNWSKSGVKKLDDLLPEKGGRPFKTIIISPWRSGATYLGQLLGSLPGVLYYYEPFANFNKRSSEAVVLKHPEISAARLKHVLKCEKFDESYLEVPDNESVKRDSTIRRPYYYDNRMWTYCREEALCNNAEFKEKFCKLFPFHIVKDVHVRLQFVEDLMKDKDLNVKVVILVRDPRAVMRSRKTNYDECKPLEHSCVRPEPICAELEQDHAVTRRLLLRYPRRIKVLRFEDLALNPSDSVRELLQFLNLHMMEAAEEFLLNENRLSNYSDSWVTEEEAFSWKGGMDFKRIEYIQDTCQRAMELWGYVPATSWTHQHSDAFIPVTNYQLHERNEILKVKEKLF